MDWQNIKHVILPTLHDCIPILALSWISTACRPHFPSCPILQLSCLEKLAVLSWLSTRIPPPDRPSTLNQLYLKGNWPDANITDLTRTLPFKTGCLPVFNRRVCNISAGQTRNTYRQTVNRNRQGSYFNRQARNCVGHAIKTNRISDKSVYAVHHSESGITSGSVSKKEFVF